MGRQKVTVDNLDKAINKILDQYGEITWHNVDEAMKKIAKKTRTAVANGSKIFDTQGHWGRHIYSRGWRVKEDRGLWWSSYIIHNGTRPTETHLLEYGHELTGVYNNQPMSGRTRAFPHIGPVAAKIPDEVQKEVTDAIYRSS